jgi:hypothetical protein
MKVFENSISNLLMTFVEMLSRRGEAAPNRDAEALNSNGSIKEHCGLRKRQLRYRMERGASVSRMYGAQR